MFGALVHGVKEKRVFLKNVRSREERKSKSRLCKKIERERERGAGKNVRCDWLFMAKRLIFIF